MRLIGLMLRCAFSSVTVCLACVIAAAPIAAQTGDGGYTATARRATARPITAGTPTPATLVAGDPTFSDGSHFQVWRYRARADEEIVVSLASREFDGFLMLIAPEGDVAQQPQMAMADTGTHIAQLAIRVPSAGEYLVVANTQRAGATGRYEITVRSLGDACAAGGPCAVAGGAASDLVAINRINGTTARVIALGATESGALEATDRRLRDSSHFDVYRYDARKGERIVIDQMSREFDSYLILTRPTPSGPAAFRENDDAPAAGNASRIENSQIAVEFPTTGSYLIVVTSFRPNATGGYQLRVRPLDAACEAGGPCTLTAPVRTRPAFYAAVQAATSPLLALGDTVRDRIASGTTALGDGTFFRSYRLRATANDELAIFLSSRAPDAPRLDTFLHLVRPSGDTLALVVADDDNGGQKNSLITTRITQSGEYYLIANGLTAADTGNFTLTAMRLADACARRRICAIGATAGQVSAGELIRMTPASAIAVGAPVAGRFTEDVTKLPDGKPFQPWRFTGRAGDRVVITNHSSDFDAFVYLYSVGADSLREIARDDDGGGGLHAQVAVELPTSGEYLVVAASFTPTANGAYRLTLETMDAACAAGGPCAPGETVAAVGRLRPALSAPFERLSLNDTLRTELPINAPRLDGGGRFRPFRFRGAANQRVVVSMGSPRFDTHVHLAQVRGQTLRLVGSDDDGGPSTDSRLVATLPEAGEYLVVASAFASTDTSGFGAFYVSVGPCDSACAAYRDGPSVRTESTYQPARRAPRRSVPAGGQVEAALSERDSTFSDGAHFHAYWIEATAGNTLRAAMQSTDFDPFLVVMRPVGDSLAQLVTDDDGAGGTNALAEWVVDRTGRYLVIATAFTRTSTGNYTLQVEQGPAADRARFVAYAATVPVRPQLAQAMAGKSRTLTMGETVTSRMTRQTPKLDGRGRFEAYRFRTTAAARVAVTMEARAFDTYLYLARIDGRTATLLATDDDGGGGTNSRVVAELPAAGEYLVIASAFSANDTTGVVPYTIKLEPCGAGCPASAPAARPTPGTDSVASSIARIARARHRDLPLGQSIQGDLTASDSTLEDGSAFHAYAFVATEGMRLRALMESAAIDPFLVLLRVDGDSLINTSSNDDGGGGTSALLEFTIVRTGRYVLVANALARDSFGRYTLHVTLTHTQRRDP